MSEKTNFTAVEVNGAIAALYQLADSLRWDAQSAIEALPKREKDLRFYDYGRKLTKIEAKLDELRRVLDRVRQLEKDL